MEISTASIFAIAGTVLGAGGKYAFKLMLNGLKKDKLENGNGQNGKAGSQSTFFWLEQNDKIVERHMAPVTQALEELKEINQDIAKGITQLVTIAEIKWK